MKSPITIQFGSGTYGKRHMEGRPLPPDIMEILLLPGAPTFLRHGQDATCASRNFRYCGQDEGIWTDTDGHGSGGEDWSYRFNLLLTEAIGKHWLTWKRLLRTHRRDPGAMEEVKRMIQQIFREVEQDVIRSLGDHAWRGGTTATLTAVIIVRRRRYIIQAAVGDSPGGLHYPAPDTSPSQTIQTVVEANCDNQVAVQRHHDRHQALGLPEPSVIYNRFNTQSSPLRDIEWPPGSGQCQPIPAWVCGTDGTMRPNVEGYEQIRRRGYYVGPQSRNRPPVHQRPNGDWAVLPGYEASNWGNSCERGNGQNLTGAGDLPANTACPCEADVCITEESRHCLAFGMSDGYGDLLSLDQTCSQIYNSNALHPQRLRFHFHRYVNSQLQPTNPEDQQYAFHYDGAPQHDDCSFVGVILDEWKPTRQGRRRHRH